LSGAEETTVTKIATADPDAYQAYLKGRYFWNRRTAENFKRAIEQFQIAADRDPGYALALVGLADCYAVSSEYVGTPSSETKPKARAYAERALAIDPSLAEAHATIAAIDDFDWQWEDSEKEFKRAIELNPNYPTTYHWYSIFLRNVGRLEESSATIKRAIELDPLSAVISVNVSRVYQVQNNHDASIANSLKIIEIDPNFGVAYEYLGLSYLAKGKLDEAIENAQKAVTLTNRSAITLGDLGYIYAMSGHRSEAMPLISELEEKYARHEAIGHDVAAVLLGLGNQDKAFEWLEKDFQARDGRLANITWEPEFDSIRNDRRYDDLLKRMNLRK
jgi:tetratricopeptide (TPR) repeat protein